MTTLSSVNGYQRANALMGMNSLGNWNLPTKNEEEVKQKNGEVIHSGHFMVSSFAEEDRDPDVEEDMHGRDSPSHHEEVIQIQHKKEKGYDFSNAIETQNTYQFGHLSTNKTITIDSSLSRLFECMSLAYNGGRVTTPKWKSFKGLKLTVKDKIRLNNLIWRTWLMEYSKEQKKRYLNNSKERRRKRSAFIQFITPLDHDAHDKPEAVIMEGKYWKRRIETVVAEYKNWRAYYMQKILHVKQSESQPLYTWEQSPTWSESMQIDPSDFDDTLFSCLSQQPFAFPNPREIAYHSNNADCMQPGLLQLQPTLDTIDGMDLEPLQGLEFLSQSKKSFPFNNNNNPLFSPFPQNTLQENAYIDPNIQSNGIKDSTSLLEDLVQDEPTMHSLLETNHSIAPTNLYQSEVYSNSAQQPITRANMFMTPTTTHFLTAQTPSTVEVSFSSAGMPPPQKLPVRRKSGSSLPRNAPIANTYQMQDINHNQANANIQQTPTANNLVNTYRSPENIGSEFGNQMSIQNLQQEFPQQNNMSSNVAFINVPINMTQQQKSTNQIQTPQYQTKQKIYQQEQTKPVQDKIGSEYNNLTLQIGYKKWPTQNNQQLLQPQVTIAKQSPTPRYVSRQKIELSSFETKKTHDPPKQTLLTQLLSKDTHSITPQVNKLVSTQDVMPSANKPSVKMQESSQASNDVGSTTSLFWPTLSPQSETSIRLIDSPETSSTAKSLKEESHSSSTFPSPEEMFAMDSSHSSVPNSPSESQKQSAEQKRRFNIKHGFESLQQILPSNNMQSNARLSKAALLGKAATHIEQQKDVNKKNEAEIQKLRAEIEALNNEISCCQQQLPITGAPVLRQHVDRMDEIFDEWVREKTLQEWKFYIFSMLIKRWFNTFKRNVTVATKEDLYKSTMAWIENHCSLPMLRMGIVNSLQELSTSTAILSDPSALPSQVENAVQQKKTPEESWSTTS